MKHTTLGVCTTALILLGACAWSVSALPPAAAPAPKTGAQRMSEAIRLINERYDALREAEIAYTHVTDVFREEPVTTELIQAWKEAATCKSLGVMNGALSFGSILWHRTKDAELRKIISDHVFEQLHHALGDVAMGYVVRCAIATAYETNWFGREDVKQRVKWIAGETWAEDSASTANDFLSREPFVPNPEWRP